MMIGRKYTACPPGETCGIGTVVIGRGAKGAKKGKDRGDIWLDTLASSQNLAIFKTTDKCILCQVGGRIFAKLN